MELPRFNPVSGATELINNSFRITEGYMNIFSRAQALKQDAEQFQMEKERFATNQTLAQLNIAQAKNQLVRQNNQLELEQYGLDAEKSKIDAERIQAKSKIDAASANETLLAEAPAFFDRVLNSGNIGEDELDQAMATINARFGHLTTDPAYASRFQQLVGPKFEALVRQRTLATQLREQKASKFFVQITKAEMIQDPAARESALREIMGSSDFEKAVGGSGPKSQALLQKWSQIGTQIGQETAALRRVEVAGRAAVAAQQAKAGAGKQLPQFLFEKMSKIAQAKDDVDQLEKAYSSGNWGPILGRIKGLNPYAKDVAALNALANAAVPNLARGVFGEVGVLTEADFKNYKEMLPSVNTPEGSMKLLVGILNRKLEGAYQQTVKRAKGQGYNTGGFADSLDEESGNDVSADDVLSAAGVKPGP